MNCNPAIYKKAFFCRQMELLIASLIKNKSIKMPVYLSIGQEHIASIASYIFPDSYIFPQHRCHSWFLNYNGKPETLLKQLLEIVDEDSNGMQGSPSLCVPGQVFGHSGLLGDQIPIAVGFADSKKAHTIVVCGDAAIEEDYALASIGYASKTNAPILFLVEDNNLSILTKKEVRRNWNIVDVARSFGINAVDINDDYRDIVYYLNSTKSKLIDGPSLININTERHRWHAGAGIDNEPETDRLDWMRLNTVDYESIESQVHREIDILWQNFQKQYGI